VFIAAFVLIGYLLYAGNDTRTKLEARCPSLIRNRLCWPPDRTDELGGRRSEGKLEVTTQKLGFTQAELSQARTLAQNIRDSQKASDEKLTAQIGQASRRPTQKSAWSAPI